MNKDVLTAGYMRDITEKCKTAFESSGQDGVIIIVPSHHMSHHDIAIANLTERAETIAARLSSNFNVVTSDKLKDLAETVNVPLSDLLDLINRFTIDPPISIRNEFEELCLNADYLALEKESKQKVSIDEDDRPFYQRAADKGGRKRKYGFHNKKRW